MLGLSACSSQKVDTGEVKGTAQESGGEYNLNQKNPFEWSADDVKRGEDGSFQGGKRSRYDARSAAAYSKDRKVPGYFSRDYQTSAWSGDKSYNTGSYRESSKASREGKRSWFGWNKSRESNKVARASGKDFRTGSYQVGAARESGNTVATPSSAYTDERQRIGAKPMIIFSQQSYRQMTVDQSRGLLGKR